MLILANTIVVYANTENTVKLATDKTEVIAGESFTITVNVASPDGINGIDTTYTYDTEKLELQSAAVKDTNFTDLSGGVEGTITLMGMSTNVTDTDIYTLTFKVKENVETGSTAKISLGDTYLATFSSETSEYTIEAQDITVTVIEEQTPPGDEGTGDEGSGDEGTGDEGTGDEGTGDEECTHTYEVKNNGTHHWEECTKCKEEKADSKKSHTYGEYKDNGNGTHSATCTVCNYKLVENHNTNGPTCKYCNAVNSNSGSNNNNNNNSVDKTTVDKEIPKAGASVLLVTGMIAVLAVAIAMYKKNQKYQDIK